MTESTLAADRRGRDLKTWLPLAAALLIVAWSYWPAITDMASRWSQDPRYSHGYLVVPFALYLLWARRPGSVDLSPMPIVGLVLIALGAGLRLVGVRFFFNWFEYVSLIPTLVGVGLLFTGWRSLRWTLPPILFLVFMMPLPYRAENALGAPLQRIASTSSTYLLQTVGLPAFAEGNIIHLNEYRIGVVDACNGLGMMFTFLGFAVAAVLLVRRNWYETALILLSAVPIAVIANVTRITATGILYQYAGDKSAQVFYHDLAGWLMMPLALAIFWVEYRLLSAILVDAPLMSGPVTPTVPILVAPGARINPGDHRPGSRRGPSR